MSPRLLLAALGAVLLFHAGCSGDGDGCEGEECLAPAVCGNGTREPSEQCDDGNKVDGDGCQADCTPTPAAPAVCGDGRLEGSEVCDDGNTTSGDGCEADCSLQVTRCAAAADPVLPGGATCEVTKAGNGARLFTGVVLKDGETLLGGQVLVDAQGVIQCAACDCGSAEGAAEATQVSCPSGVISPGLINPHEHITYPAPPYVGTEERYEHRHEWRAGKNGHTRISSPANSGGDFVRWGELRQMMAGATSIAGAGGQLGLLRNLDVNTAGQQEGLGEGVADSDTFPLGDSNGTMVASGCSYSSMQTAAALPAASAYLPHIAEGIATTAYNEFVCLSSGANDVIRARTAVIHGIGLTAKEIALMAERGTGLIWSPRSNVSLYGDTAMVTAYQRAGVQIALGTDWLRSGSMNLLRELRCADDLNRNHYARAFTDEQLWRMVTANAADLTDTFEKVGRIAPGKLADLAIYRLGTHTASPHRAVVAANAEDVVLTMRGGKPLYGNQALIDALKGSDTCDTLDVCGVAQAVCLQGEIGKNLAALQTAMSSQYPLFACGTPKDEPTCSPERSSGNSRWPASVNGSTVYTGESRANDPDGDGLTGTNDNCPTIFNPVRPMDDRKQADSDGDGIGDACDPCPLAAGDACSLFSVGDDDHDGLATWQDNCAFTANADQADADSDGKGDACDVCATTPNPGDNGCPSTIHAVKTAVDGNLPLLNQQVALTDVIVTAVARSTTGYWVQVHPLPDGVGVENSGLYVAAAKAGLAVGDRIDITTGTLKVNFSLPQLTDVKWVKRSEGNALPAPVVVRSEQVRTGGPRASALEGVLLEVQDVSVITALDQYSQFLVSEDAGAETGLMVDDQAFTYGPQTPGTRYTALRGVLTFNFDDSKLVPRSRQDLVLPPPTLTAFGPTGYVRLGGEGAVNTFPQALTLTLSSTYPDPLTITVTSSDTSALTVPEGQVVVPVGQTSVQVPVVPHAAATSVTLTATLGSSTRTATVRVLGETEQALVSGLTPTPVKLVPGGTASFTVALDRPAASGTSVALSAEPAEGFGTFSAANGALAVDTNAMGAAFTFTADAAIETSTSGTVTASLGDSSATATVNVDAAAPRLVAMTPEMATVPASRPQEFTVTLDRTQADDVDVALAVLPGTGVTHFGAVPATVRVPAGQMTATFTFTADAEGEGSGRVSASLFGLTRVADVTVLPPPPKLASVSPATATVIFNETQAFTVTLDRRAPEGGIVVDVALTPASLGSLESATVTIPAGQTSAQVTFTAGEDEAEGRFSATYAGVTREAEVTVTDRPTVDHIVISEVSARGATSQTDEFVELYNPTGADITLNGWKIQYKSAAGTTSYSGSSNIPDGTVIKAGGYLLLANNAYTGTVTKDVTYNFDMSASATAGGHVRVGPNLEAANLNDPNTADKVGWGTANQPEGNAAPAHPAAGGSLERKARAGSTGDTMATGGADASAGNGYDTGDNAEDFVVRTTRDPQNAQSAVELP